MCSFQIILLLVYKEYNNFYEKSFMDSSQKMIFHRPFSNLFQDMIEQSPIG